MNVLTRKVKLFDFHEHQIGQFDLLKGMFLIGMILSHSCYDFLSMAVSNYGGSRLVGAMYRTIIPCSNAGNAVLMMICGYGFRKKSMVSAIRVQTKHLWKPYLLTTLAVFVAVTVFTLLTKGNLRQELGRRALPFLLGNTNERPYFGITMDNGIGPMWFILAFIVSGIVLNAILQYQDETMQWIMAVLLYGFGTTGSIGKFTILVDLPFGLYNALKCTLYMYIGYQMKKECFFDKEFPVWMIVILTVFCVIAIYIGRNDLFSDLFIALVMLAVSLLLNRVKCRLFGWFRMLGRNIVTFCCIHTVFYAMLSNGIVEERFANRPIVGIVIEIAIYAITGIGGCIIVDQIKRRRIMKKRQKAIGI